MDEIEKLVEEERRKIIGKTIADIYIEVGTLTIKFTDGDSIEVVAINYNNVDFMLYEAN